MQLLLDSGADHDVKNEVREDHREGLTLWLCTCWNHWCLLVCLQFGSGAAEMAKAFGREVRLFSKNHIILVSCVVFTLN